MLKTIYQGQLIWQVRQPLFNYYQYQQPMKQPILYEVISIDNDFIILKNIQAHTILYYGNIINNPTFESYQIQLEEFGD